MHLGLDFAKKIRESKCTKSKDLPKAEFQTEGEKNKCSASHFNASCL